MWNKQKKWNKLMFTQLCIFTQDVDTLIYKYSNSSKLSHNVVLPLSQHAHFVHLVTEIVYWWDNYEALQSSVPFPAPTICLQLITKTAYVWLLYILKKFLQTQTSFESGTGKWEKGPVNPCVNSWKQRALLL